MKRTTLTILTVIIALITIAIPTYIAIRIAIKQGLDSESDRVLAYARDVLHRSDSTSEQVYSGIEQLQHSKAKLPCAEDNIALMRQLDLSSTYIQAFGYMTGDFLICSSLGQHDPPLDLGKVELVTSTGTGIRNNVEFPFTKGLSFIVLERSSYVAVIHKDLPIDISTEENDISLATYTPDNSKIRTSRGFIKTEWIGMANESGEITFIDSGYIVAVVKSEEYATGAIAALPTSYLDQRIREFVILLVPIGAIAGLVMAIAILSMARQQLELPAVIKSGLRRNEFYLAYQPIVDLETGNWLGAEALIRWRRPSGEEVRPDLFIHVAEDTGLIQRITERVMDLIAQDAADFFAQYPDFHISINLSSIDLKSTHTIELLRRLSHVTGAGQQNLIVEATERGFLNTDNAREVIRTMRADGARIAIDDFGTGYSSLSYLQAFEIDILKIDKSFIDTLGTEAPTSHVVIHIIEIAKTLNLEMVAEGVETEAQAQFLRTRGVKFAQGFLFSKPISFSALVYKLAEQQQVRQIKKEKMKP